MPDTIQDLLVAHGFSINQEDQQFIKVTSTYQYVAVPFAALAGHTVETFAAMAKEKGWLEE